MKASHRDFDCIAQIVKKVRARMLWKLAREHGLPEVLAVDHLDQTLEAITYLLSDKLRESNPDFNPKLFKAACGYPEEE